MRPPLCDLRNQLIQNTEYGIYREGLTIFRTVKVVQVEILSDWQEVSGRQRRS